MDFLQWESHQNWWCSLEVSLHRGTPWPTGKSINWILIWGQLGFSCWIFHAWIFQPDFPARFFWRGKLDFPRQIFQPDFPARFIWRGTLDFPAWIFLARFFVWREKMDFPAWIFFPGFFIWNGWDTRKRMTTTSYRAGQKFLGTPHVIAMKRGVPKHLWPARYYG